MTLQELHEKLLTWATAAPRQVELLRARRDYFDRWGEPHEEERSFEARMNGMLDYFLYDHRPGGGQDTTLDLFLRDQAPAYGSDELARFRALGKGIHSLFEVRKIRAGDSIDMRDVLGGQVLKVAEGRPMVGMEKGDLLEARLLPHDGAYHFSGAFLFHPREVRKQVLAEAKKRRKGAGRGPVDVKGFLAQLSRMAQKLERYRNVKVESLYDFRPPPKRPGKP